MKKLILLIILTSTLKCFGQGYNHQWLLGNNPFINFPNGRAFFDSTTSSFISEYRKMSFMGTEANICDENGNLLMSSNGVWIADATGDTMQNGSGLNPNSFTSSWPYGQIIPYGNIILPYPEDSNKYILIHQTGDSLNIVPSTELFSSVIKIDSSSNLGYVDILNKNILLFHDTLSWGITAVKHANGTDWWIVVMKDSSNVALIIKLSHNGITNIISQNLNYPYFTRGTGSQLTFSPDGTKFIAMTYDNPNDRNCFLVVSDFDRCTGLFSNTQTLHLTSGAYLWGLAFSPSGRYIYACSSMNIFQIDATTLTVDTVATNDGFISPVGSSCCATTFWNMYLAANGKIYVTSGSSVQHIHEINYPDSAGIACDVQQHSVNLQNYLHLRAVPNHPNYYLGCDTTQTTCPCLITGINNLSPPDFKFRVYPNPVTHQKLSIGYLLPQNKYGIFEIMDVTGKIVFRYTLPPWSNEQSFSLPNLANGVYNCSITSNSQRLNKKIIIFNE